MTLINIDLYCIFNNTVCRYKLPLSEAEKYVDRITEADDRFELYMELSLYRKAADTATRMKDPIRLQEVLYRTALYYKYSLKTNLFIFNFLFLWLQCFKYVVCCMLCTNLVLRVYSFPYPSIPPLPPSPPLFSVSLSHSFSLSFSLLYFPTPSRIHSTWYLRHQICLLSW